MKVAVIIAVLVYVLGFIAFAALAVLSWVIWDRRFKSKDTKQVPPGYVKTDEVFIDPTTQRRISVYYNPQTAERFYKDEN